jgi:hypothetical protein
VIEGVVGDVYVLGFPVNNLCRVLGPNTSLGVPPNCCGLLNIRHVFILDDGFWGITNSVLYQESLINWRPATDTEALAARLRYGL